MFAFLTHARGLVNRLKDDLPSECITVGLCYFIEDHLRDDPCPAP